MVTEFRIKMLEGDMNRRWDDHDKEHVKLEDRMSSAEAQLAADEELRAMIRDIRNYAKKTYEVFEPMAKIMGKIAKWGTRFALAYAACMYGISWAITHINNWIPKLMLWWRT